MKVTENGMIEPENIHIQQYENMISKGAWVIIAIYVAEFIGFTLKEIKLDLKIAPEVI